MNRNEIKKKELALISSKEKENPLLFKKETFIESPEFLKKFGIFIKGKDNYPLGYLKLWPQDFIVEETDDSGKLHTINTSEEKEVNGEGKTIYATMVKCGLSTLEAVEELSNILNLDKKKINFAGIKDKDAITSQLISMRGVNINDVKNIESPSLFLKDIYHGKGIVEIGKLKSNKFTILIRTTKDFQKKLFLDNLKKLDKEGFFNFFYLQRFGTPRLINFHWGFLILKGEYEKAVLSFLSSPGERELPYFIKLREKLKENFGNWQEIENILSPLPLFFQCELRVVSFLKKYPNNFAGALKEIPEQIKLWIFAFSSLLFNDKLSSYIKEGKEPPEIIPLILSDDKKDLEIYKTILSKNKADETIFNNLNNFPFIQLKKREINTKEKINIIDYKIVNEGVILSFTLPKGSYATTFLSQLFNLASGLPPKDIYNYTIDTKATLGEESLENVLNKFKDVIYSKEDSPQN